MRNFTASDVTSLQLYSGIEMSIVVINCDGGEVLSAVITEVFPLLFRHLNDLLFNSIIRYSLTIRFANQIFVFRPKSIQNLSWPIRL